MQFSCFLAVINGLKALINSFLLSLHSQSKLYWFCAYFRMLCNKFILKQKIDHVLTLAKNGNNLKNFLTFEDVHLMDKNRHKSWCSKSSSPKCILINQDHLIFHSLTILNYLKLAWVMLILALYWDSWS